jgi:lysophospholipase L1-like esterase
MLECLILGDSIAEGLGQIKSECAVAAKSGINSAMYVTYFTESPKTKTKVAIISLGSNDTSTVDTEENVTKLRKELNADKVYWILPSPKKKSLQRLTIIRVANKFGDWFLEIPELSEDKIHPTFSAYKHLAVSTNK